jgi:predicted CopG family antitoxin
MDLKNLFEGVLKESESLREKQLRPSKPRTEERYSDLLARTITKGREFLRRLKEDSEDSEVEELVESFLSLRDEFYELVPLETIEMVEEARSAE